VNRGAEAPLCDLSRRLGVVASSSERLQPRLVDLHFEGMEFVGTVTDQTVKGDDIKGACIRNAGCDLACHIVIRYENPAAALSGKNLQAEIS
jgi:hypothetical protein